MTVVIAGGTGFLGQKLVRRLSDDGHRVVVLSRRQGGSNTLTWQPDGSPGNLPQHLAGVDAVVNLAGAGIADRRWSPSRKAVLRASRTLATRTLARAIAACEQPPRVFVSASAVGYYGPRGDEPVTEATPPGADFFATLAIEWEQEAQAAATTRTRVAIIRTGLVLSSDGGVLGKMLLPFKIGVGGVLGSGEQYMSWVHEDDWTAMVTWLIRDERASGAFNVTAPTPVTNREFTSALGRALRRPTILPVPSFALRLALGELSDALLTGQRVLPRHAEQLGFQFRHTTLDAALASLNL